MKKRLRKDLTLIIAILCTFLVHSSCDDEYDLNKEINTDINLLSNVTLPIGDSEEIKLDEIIETSDDISVNNDGLYEISTSGDISSEINAIDNVTITGFAPDIEDVDIDVLPVSFLTSNFELSDTYTQGSDFDIYAQFEINEVLPVEVDSFNSATIISDDYDGVPISITVEVTEIPTGIDHLEVNNLTVKLPSIIIAEDTNSNNEIIFADFELSGEIKTFTQTIYITKLNIPEGDEDKYIKTIDTDKYLVIDESMNLTADIVTYITPILTSSTVIKLEINSSAPTASISEISGTFTTSDKIETEVTLGDLPDFIKDTNNVISPSDVTLYLELNNPLNTNIITELQITSYDDNDNLISDTVSISITLVPNDNAIAVKNIDEIESGYTTIVCEELTSLFSVIPNKFVISSTNITAEAIDDTQSIQLGTPYELDGNFSVLLPFAFENIQLTYSDSIEGLKEDLEDYVDITDEITVSAKVINTIPAELNLSTKCLDSNGNELTGVIIDLTKFTIAASQNDVATTSEIEFSISESSGSNDLENLATIEYNVTANSIESGIELKPTQYIQFTEIKITIPNGINIEL